MKNKIKKQFYKKWYDFYPLRHQNFQTVHKFYLLFSIMTQLGYQFYLDAHQGFEVKKNDYLRTTILYGGSATHKGFVKSLRKSNVYFPSIANSIRRFYNWKIKNENLLKFKFRFKSITNNTWNGMSIKLLLIIRTI